jgi:hypothetical protein
MHCPAFEVIPITQTDYLQGFSRVPSCYDLKLRSTAEAVLELPSNIDHCLSNIYKINQQFYMSNKSRNVIFSESKNNATTSPGVLGGGVWGRVLGIGGLLVYGGSKSIFFLLFGGVVF